MMSDRALVVASRVADLGGRLYEVGGSVRDRLLYGVRSGDRDFCVVGVGAEAFASLVPDGQRIDGAFPVFRLQVDGEGLDFAMARSETKTGPGHRGFATRQVERLEEDLARRDITVNAIAVDVLTGEIIDPFGGRADLAKRVLRAVSPAFREDPLRVYRVARFASTLGFEVDCETLAIMRSLHDQIGEVSCERVGWELCKALRSAEPSTFIRMLDSADALDVHFPEVAALKGVEQPALHHPEGDAFEHSLLAMDAAAALGGSEMLAYCALVHDLGKGITPASEWPRHIGHEQAGKDLAETLGERLRLPREWIEAGADAALLHGSVHRVPEMRPWKIVTLIERARKSPLGVTGLALVADADSLARGGAGTADPGAEMLRKLEATYLSVNGRDFLARMEPGPELGRALKAKRADLIARSMSDDLSLG